jgi:hypothetical protein
MSPHQILPVLASTSSSAFNFSDDQHFEGEFIIDREQHAGVQVFACQRIPKPDHRSSGDVGSGALNLAVDSMAYGERACVRAFVADRLAGAAAERLSIDSH